MTELYREHLEMEGSIRHVRVAQMAAQDMRPVYGDVRVVDSESRDISHLIGRISVLDRPFEEADVAADQTEVWVCGCDDFYYNQSSGVGNGNLKPSQMGHCKHIISEVRAEKAKQDENQEELL